MSERLQGKTLYLATNSGQIDKRNWLWIENHEIAIEHIILAKAFFLQTPDSYPNLENPPSVLEVNGTIGGDTPFLIASHASVLEKCEVVYITEEFFAWPFALEEVLSLLDEYYDYSY